MTFFGLLNHHHSWHHYHHHHPMIINEFSGDANNFLHLRWWKNLRRKTNQTTIEKKIVLYTMIFFIEWCQMNEIRWEEKQLPLFLSYLEWKKKNPGSIITAKRNKTTKQKYTIHNQVWENKMKTYFFSKKKIVKI